MTDHSESRIVPYTADLMYGVVSDVEHYPQFLPWVAALRLLSRGENSLTAEMAVGYGALRERYVSRVALDPAARTIDVVQAGDAKTKSPFRQLENHWRFTPLDDGHCRIDFSIAFAFRNPLLQAAAGRAFSRLVFQMADAFEARAAVLARG